MRSIVILLLAVIANAFAAAQIPAIKVEKVGTGTPVVLLPGFGCPGDVWDETAAQLSKSHQCIVVSCAGFAGMAPLDTLWMSKVEASIEELIRGLPSDNVTIIGHSFGGTLGIMAAKALPSKVKRLVVAEMLPCIGMTMIPNYKPEYISFDNPYNLRLLHMNDKDFADMQIQSAQNMTADTARQRQIADWMAKCDRKTYVYEYTELLRTDLRQEIKEIKQPTLVLAAGRYPSKEQIMQIYNEQYAAMPNKTITFIDNSSHFIMYDQFDKFIDEILRFVE